jgi:AcrR family transcriptional regulator
MPVERSLDRRSRRSRAALESALLELIAEQDLTQISVADVTGRADVHRSTFYEHYTDVHDLAESACTSLFDGLLTATSGLAAAGGTEASMRATLTALYVHVSDHRALYRALLGPSGSARVINHLLARTADSVRDGLSGAAFDSLELTPLSGLIAGALLGTVAEWLRRDCAESPEELSAAVWPYLLTMTAHA